MDRIQELEHLNQMLMDQNAIKDKLIAVITHEVRNQLQSISILMQMLLGEKDPISRSEFNELVQNVSSSSQKATMLLNDMMFWSEYKTVERPEDFYDELNLYRFTEECLRTICCGESGKNIAYVNNIDKKIYLNTDIKMLNLVFRLLVQEYKKKEKIIIDAATDGEMIEIRISGGDESEADNVDSELMDVNSRFIKYGIKGEKGTGIGPVFCKDFLEKNKAKLMIKGHSGKDRIYIISLPREMLVFI